MTTRVPDRECIHAAEMIDHLSPEDLIRMQQDFSIAGRPKHAAATFQLATQLTIIVNFSVERDPRPQLRKDHRLIAIDAQIDNRETPMGQRDAPVFRQPATGGVGTTFGHRVANPQHVSLADGRSA